MQYFFTKKLAVLGLFCFAFAEIDTMIPKFIWKSQGVSNSQNNMKKGYPNWRTKTSSKW